MSQKVFVTRQIPEVGIKMLKDRGYEVDVFPKDRILKQKELIMLTSRQAQYSRNSVRDF